MLVFTLTPTGLIASTLTALYTLVGEPPDQRNGPTSNCAGPPLVSPDIPETA